MMVNGLDILWMLSKPGEYTFKLRFASQEDGGKFRFSMNDQDITEVRTENNTGGWYSFKNHIINGVFFESG